MTKTLHPLTPKESRVLKFIEEFILRRGFAPTYQEIQSHFGFASINSIQNYIRQLSQKGYVNLPKSNSKRSLQVLRSSETTRRHLEELQPQSPSQNTGSSRASLLQAQGETLSLPLMGRVAAGQPIERIEHDEFIDVPPSMVRNAAKTFALKVEGDSMIEDGILDGDIILVQEQNQANNGEIVVAVVDEEATVKRFYLDSSQAKPRVELRPANSKMQSMWFSYEQVGLRGVVVGLIRNF